MGSKTGTADFEVDDVDFDAVDFGSKASSWLAGRRGWSVAVSLGMTASFNSSS